MSSVGGPLGLAAALRDNSPLCGAHGEGPCSQRLEAAALWVSSIWSLDDGTKSLERFSFPAPFSHLVQRLIWNISHVAL